MKGFFLLNFKVYFDYMKPILTIFCGLMTFMTQAQISNNFCDSIIIQSCQTNATGEQIEVIVSNYSTNIMSYPGFVILSENGDTIALEEVNYFGIGFNQLHILNVINPPNLPMSITLELHTLFYDSLECSWNMTLGLNDLAQTPSEHVHISPNPAKEWIEIKNLHDQHSLEIKIFNAFGKALEFHRDGQFIDVSKFPKGMYYLELRDVKTTQNSKFLIQ